MVNFVVPVVSLIKADDSQDDWGRLLGRGNASERLDKIVVALDKELGTLGVFSGYSDRVLVIREDIGYLVAIQPCD